MKVDHINRARSAALGAADRPVRGARTERVVFSRGGARADAGLRAATAGATAQSVAKATVGERVGQLVLQTIHRLASLVRMSHVHYAKKSPEQGTLTNEQILTMKKAMVQELATSLKGKMGTFDTIWLNRHQAPKLCAKFLDFAALDVPENSEFLRALDSLRESPGIGKAERMVTDFLLQPEVDDNMQPVAGQGKWSINLRDDKFRNDVITNVRECIDRAKAHRSPENLRAIVEAFAMCESYIVSLVVQNCKLTADVNQLRSSLAKASAAPLQPEG